MDFFASQDVARRKTGILICYFALALILMIVVLYFATVVLVQVLANTSDSSQAAALPPFTWWRLDVFIGVVFFVSLVVGGGSAYKILELGGGGHLIAQQLGGQAVSPVTTDFQERQLLNIVEEMAIASGIPAPPVFVLNEEKGINAFAAGFSPSSAVIGVNRGTIDQLNRDELQGVIAHEFSHILNGDMRLNLRLIGILHGILLIGLIGRLLLYAGAHSGRSSRKDNGAILFLALGAVAFGVGSIGFFFARLIKAAISRQREYLADASAVQFTRNPLGIGGALKKIGGYAYHSRMKTPNAELASHMFFGSAYRQNFISLLATHPPLDDRIKRIDPSFDGNFSEVEVHRKQPPAKTPPKQPIKSAPKIMPVGRFPLDPREIMATIGVLAAAQIEYSAQLLDSFPEKFKQALHETFSARAVVFALLLDEDRPIQEAQFKIIEQLEDQATRHETAKISGIIATLPTAARLPILEIVQTTLRDLSPEQYNRFRETVMELVKADNKIALFEFVVHRVLLEHLDRYFYRKKPPVVRYHSLQGVLEEAVLLLSALAHVGHRDDAQAAAVFQSVSSFLTSPGRVLQILPQAQCTLQALNAALMKLSQSSPAIKKRVLGAAVACVAADGEAMIGEVELLRAISESLECPMPPIAPGKIAAGK